MFLRFTLRIGLVDFVGYAAVVRLFCRIDQLANRLPRLQICRVQSTILFIVHVRLVALTPTSNCLFDIRRPPPFRAAWHYFH